MVYIEPIIKGKKGDDDKKKHLLILQYVKNFFYFHPTCLITQKNTCNINS